MQLTKHIRDGQKYMDSWPMRKELAVLLPEYQMIRMTRLGQKWMPMLAIVSICLPISMGSLALLPSATASALLMLSLPLQGLYWLGKRSNDALSPELRNWYQTVHQSLLEHGQETVPRKATPTFYDLAKVLKQAYGSLDKFAPSA